jgi:hypothetical protein
MVYYRHLLLFIIFFNICRKNKICTLYFMQVIVHIFLLLHFGYLQNLIGQNQACLQKALWHARLNQRSHRYNQVEHQLGS